MADIAQRIVKLREAVQRNQSLRAEAEASLKMAAQRLSQIDKELKELGVDPANAEAEASALEAQLEQTVTELEEAVTKEAAAYQQILQQSQDALR